MAGLDRISTRVILTFLAIHIVLLPALGFALLFVVETGLKDSFVSHVRSYTRSFADTVETGDFIRSAEDLLPFLDDVILGQEGVYAEITLNGQSIRSSISQLSSPGEQDFVFGDHSDDAYFLTVFLDINDSEGKLILGFDESSVVEQIYVMRWQIGSLLGGFLLLSIIFLALFTNWLTTPINRLRQHSHVVAAGDWAQKLETASGLREIDDLAADLDFMRQQLVGTNERLQQEIEERRLAVERRSQIEKQLRQAQKIESIGTLAGGMAHEFNNLLLPMMINMELIMEDLPKDHPVVNDLQKVLNSIKRARSLVERIMEFSRQTGREHQEVVDVQEVIREAMDWMRAVIPSNVSIDVQIIGVPSSVVIDPAQLHQVVVNLCNNAVQAMEKTGGKLTIRLQEVESDIQNNSERQLVRCVELSVSDTGEGMSDQLQERLFEPFFTTRNVGSGTGLGMSVVHGIVSSAGGHVDVESSIDSGTRVIIRLPALFGNITVSAQPNPGGNRQ